MTKRITGRKAIAYAEERGATLFKYSDPIDGARELSVDEARKIAAEDPRLVYAIAPADRYHVTRVSGEGVYGHNTSHCDPSGCNGHELYLSGIGTVIAAAVNGGDVIEEYFDHGDGDKRITGWRLADGTRVINTNGNPIGEDDDGFGEMWDAHDATED